MARRTIVLAIVVSILATLAACAPAAPTPAPTTAKPVATIAAVSTKAPEATKPAATSTPPPAPTPTPKPATLKFGSIQGIADAGVYLAMDKGYFKDQGITVELTNFRLTTEMIAPLGTGQLDAGIQGVGFPLLVAADRGVELKVVAGAAQSVPKWEFAWIVLRKDLADSGQIKTPSDLKGVKIAISSLGSLADLVVQMLLEQGGLKPGEADVVVLPFAEHAAAFANKAIAASYSIEPFIARGIQEGFSVKWIPQNQFFGGKAQGSFLVFGPTLAKDQDLARRWMTAYLKGVRDYISAFATREKRDELVSTLIKYSTIKDPKLYEFMEMPYIEPNGQVDKKSIDAQYKWYLDKGLYTGKKTFDDIMDLSHGEYAVQKLGKYQ